MPKYVRDLQSCIVKSFYFDDETPVQLAADGPILDFRTADCNGSENDRLKYSAIDELRREARGEVASVIRRPDQRLSGEITFAVVQTEIHDVWPRIEGRLDGIGSIRL